MAFQLSATNAKRHKRLTNIWCTV